MKRINLTVLLIVFALIQSSFIGVGYLWGAMIAFALVLGLEIVNDGNLQFEWIVFYGFLLDLFIQRPLGATVLVLVFALSIYRAVRTLLSNVEWLSVSVGVLLSLAVGSVATNVLFILISGGELEILVILKDLLSGVALVIGFVIILQITKFALPLRV